MVISVWISHLSNLQSVSLPPLFFWFTLRQNTDYKVSLHKSKVMSIRDEKWTKSSNEQIWILLASSSSFLTCHNTWSNFTYVVGSSLSHLFPLFVVQERVSLQDHHEKPKRRASLRDSDRGWRVQLDRCRQIQLSLLTLARALAVLPARK